MIKQTLEGLSILQSPPQIQGGLKAPIARLNEGLILDDSIFECPTLIMGSVGSGKSRLMEEIMRPILGTAEEVNENVFVFCAKENLLKFKRPQDIVISVDSTAPNACWNIIKEVSVSKNPELTARDIAKSLTKDQRSDLQPFFENSCNDLLFNAIMAVYEDGLKQGVTYTNWHLFDFLNRVSLNQEAELSWYTLAETRPERFSHILDYLGDGLGQGYGIISEIRTLLHDCFWGSFCSAKGQFSSIETLKTGGKRIFLYYDHANASEASIKMFKTILNLLLKHSVDEDNGRRTWFFLDEFSLLPETGIIDSMSLGRGAGFRLFACIQSAQLMTRHYKEDAKALLSLFPNIICLKVQDAMSRSILSDRYGECLASYSFNAPMQKVIQYAEHRKVVADYDFTRIQKKGDALMSIPNLSDSPFFYHGYRKEFEVV